jgi:hypothetical protein
MAFEDRYEMALDVTAVACGDLKSLAEQLRLVRWAIPLVRRSATLHHLNASMAFVDGAHCAEGLGQSPYFAKRAKESAKETDTAEPADDQGAQEEGAGEDESEEASGAGELACFGKDFSHRLVEVERRSEESTEMIVAVMRRAKLDMAAEFKSIWAGYDAFCTSRLGMPAERVLEGCKYPGRIEFADVLERYKDVAGDEQATAAYRDGMCGFWDRRFEDDK